ncbi:DUF1622 domain-containing protein [Nocardioides sp. HM23]|uniref:DUF1622 domain-containing protein n=1 Tax=Nocardioides bizhenqiangii TaxID=3095076 RepID=UPI002ACA0DE1|nr:DUF1622 domain-containing protein [Nocardioides sp. HM23]MDZ5623061.1 DUF1622 domain-containing protein [Nocardioides sp. HM23]
MGKRLVPISAPQLFGTDCLDFGSNLASPVSLDYAERASFPFAGSLDLARVVYLWPPAPAPAPASRPETGMHFDEAMERVVQGFEIGGVVILVVGSLAAMAHAAWSWRRVGGEGAYALLRRGVGRAILLGLEFLIIADIVLTITIEPTLDSALALGLIVLVRTFLSFSLEIELEGALPWRRSPPPVEPDPSGSG